MIYCYGRHSGTDSGWMMFADNNGNIWEEKTSEWEEILNLIDGSCTFRRKSDGFIAQQAGNKCITCGSNGSKCEYQYPWGKRGYCLCDQRSKCLNDDIEKEAIFGDGEKRMMYSR